MFVDSRNLAKSLFDESVSVTKEEKLACFVFELVGGFTQRFGYTMAANDRQLDYYEIFIHDFSPFPDNGFIETACDIFRCIISDKQFLNCYREEYLRYVERNFPRNLVDTNKNIVENNMDILMKKIDLWKNVRS